MHFLVLASNASLYRLIVKHLELYLVLVVYKRCAHLVTVSLWMSDVVFITDNIHLAQNFSLLSRCILRANRCHDVLQNLLVQAVLYVYTL